MGERRAGENEALNDRQEKMGLALFVLYWG